MTACRKRYFMGMLAGPVINRKFAGNLVELLPSGLGMAETPAEARRSTAATTISISLRSPRLSGQLSQAWMLFRLCLQNIPAD
jgi:hypothetical protein